MLKKGYNIVCTSWENDGDYYNTEVVTIQTENEVHFWLEWLKLFESRHDHYRISNEYDSCGNTEHLIERTLNLIEHYGGPKVLFPDYDLAAWPNMPDDEIIDFCHEIVYDFTGASEDYGFRVVEEVKVYYAEKDFEPLIFE